MMVPAETLLALTVVFFIREICMQSKKKPTGYNSGYRQAFEDMADKWNAVNKETNDWKEHCTRIRDYIQRMLDGRL